MPTDPGNVRQIDVFHQADLRMFVFKKKNYYSVQEIVSIGI